MNEIRANGKKATQPCPCGHSGDRKHDCRCSGEQIQRYAARISGPLLDRIDLHVEVPRPDQSILKPSGPEPEDSASVAARVLAARQVQLDRQGCWNALLGNRDLKRFCAIGTADRRLLEHAADRLALSPRAVHRILKVARTLADLDAAASLSGHHLAEAIAYRSPVTGRQGASIELRFISKGRS